MDEKVDQQTWNKKAEREKATVALSSVVAAIFLTAMKVVVGIWTGSLGILAEAAHSGLDLVAALVTYLAVRVSGRPADETHPYGHGKVENLSALVETLLLLITCVWIIYEGINRLFFRPAEIEANLWAFAVVVISIIIDFNRSRVLRRVADKYESQALEADALHFSTDIWSSAVVLVGLAIVKIQEWTGAPPFLAKADAVAALGVAIIVIYVSLQLGRRSVEALLDTAPRGLAEKIKSQVHQIHGVTDCRQVRIRRAGATTFADIVLAVDGGASLETAHEITHRVEEAVRRLIPGADVLVHYEPSDLRPGLAARIGSIAESMGAGAHSIWAREDGGRYHVELHLEVDRDATLQEAHDLATRVEARIKEALPEIADVVAHLEPVGEIATPHARLSHEDRTRMEEGIVTLVNSVVGEGACHDVAVWEEESRLAASLHCSFSPEVSIEEAHDLSEDVERLLLSEFSQLRRVVIHLEPPE